MPATLKTVAQACGVDVSTVSRALRGDPRVAGETVERVRKAAEKLGYRPNLGARALQAGATRTVWCLVGSLDIAFERSLAQGAAVAVEAAGYDLLLASHRDDDQAYERLLMRLDQGVADAAVIIPGNRRHPRSPALTALLERRYPLVFLDRSPGGEEIPTVTTDNAGATTELVRRLAAAGAKRLAVLIGDSNDVATVRRESSLREAVRLGLPVSRAPDAAWLAAGSGCLGVISTAQGTVHHFCAEHADLLRSTELRFAAFDTWVGEPHPASLALVAVQDFAGMARRAAERVLAAVADPAAWSPAVERLPPLRIDEVRARF